MRDIAHFVVGVDSSDCSQQALDWSSPHVAAHAECPLLIVT